ncbi:MAG: LysR family transcriptional regulator [Magnetococcales bacterium]|nr:LysR family transcriptional regulator [Magnetococcales bacterium]MBF0438337.1 LysR family transcriptional regulator [Magnetococcales bacterium]
MDRLILMETFIRVVDGGSFSAAARKGGISRAAVSKYMVALEEHLGVRLINRTTRQLHLTEEGEMYYQRCRRILEDLLEAEQIVTHQHAAPRGLLRVTAPISFGRLHLVGVAADFLLKFSGIEMDLVLNDRFVDLVEEGFDVGVRIGTLRDSSLMARRLASSGLVLCASPEYVARFGQPMVPEDLVGHACLLYSYAASPNVWRFGFKGEERVVRVKGSLRCNNGEALQAAVRAGLGIAILPSFLIEGDLRTRTLLPLLSDFLLPQLGIYAVYPSNRHLSVKVRTFIDFLVVQLGACADWSGGDKGVHTSRGEIAQDNL